MKANFFYIGKRKHTNESNTSIIKKENKGGIKNPEQVIRAINRTKPTTETIRKQRSND